MSTPISEAILFHLPKRQWLPILNRRTRKGANESWPFTLCHLSMEQVLHLVARQDKGFTFEAHVYPPLDAPMKWDGRLVDSSVKEVYPVLIVPIQFTRNTKLSLWSLPVSADLPCSLNYFEALCGIPTAMQIEDSSGDEMNLFVTVDGRYRYRHSEDLSVKSRKQVPE